MSLDEMIKSLNHSAYFKVVQTNEGAVAVADPEALRAAVAVLRAGQEMRLGYDEGLRTGFTEYERIYFAVQAWDAAIGGKP